MSDRRALDNETEWTEKYLLITIKLQITFNYTLRRHRRTYKHPCSLSRRSVLSSVDVNSTETKITFTAKNGRRRNSRCSVGLHDQTTIILAKHRRITYCVMWNSLCLIMTVLVGVSHQRATVRNTENNYYTGTPQFNTNDENVSVCYYHNNTR